MIADLKRTVLLYPHLYQAKQQLLFFLLFAMLGVANIRDNYNGADLMMPVFLWSFFALMPSTNLVRLDYAAHTSTSPHRKRMMTVIPALILFVLQIVMWCMVVLVAVITGRSAARFMSRTTIIPWARSSSPGGRPTTATAGTAT